MIDTVEMDMTGVLRLENAHHVHLTCVDHRAEPEELVPPTGTSPRADARA
jgi:hypothetical protein